MSRRGGAPSPTFTGYTTCENRRVFAHLRTDRALGGCYLTIALDDDDPPDGEPALDPEPAHPIRTA